MAKIKIIFGRKVKTWFRVAISLCVIFGASGTLLFFKTLQIPTSTTGELILITGTSGLIIGGILLLSLTLLGVKSTRIAVEKKKPTEEYLEKALLHDLDNMDPRNIEGKFAWNVGAGAHYLRKQRIKNLTVYKAFASAIKKVAQRLRGYLKKRVPSLEIYTLDLLSENPPEVISYLFDKFSKLYGQMAYVSKRLGTKYKLNYVPRKYLKEFSSSLA